MATGVYQKAHEGETVVEQIQLPSQKGHKGIFNVPHTVIKLAP